jgi:DnaJ-class molecular chaperone
MTLNIPDYDLYDELEVAPHASLATIQAAYRALSKHHHPDTARNKSAAEAKMKRLNVAHDILKDPGSRAAYDAIRTEAQRPPPPPPPPGRDRSSNPFAGPANSSARSRSGGLTCTKCGKRFKTPGGLEWHRANNRNCVMG